MLKNALKVDNALRARINAKPKKGWQQPLCPWSNLNPAAMDHRTKIPAIAKLAPEQNPQQENWCKILTYSLLVFSTCFLAGSVQPSKIRIGLTSMERSMLTYFRQYRTYLGSTKKKQTILRFYTKSRLTSQMYTQNKSCQKTMNRAAAQQVISSSHLPEEMQMHGVQ